MQYKVQMPDESKRLLRVEKELMRVEWCREQFGSESLFSNYGRWHRYKGHIYFSDEQDYLFYLLRWAS